MTMLSKPSAEKTRALRDAVASYQDHIGNHKGAEFMRAQPDDFTQWSDYAHQLVTVMDKKTFEKDLPPNIQGMMDFSKERAEARTEKNRALAGLAEGIGKGKKGRRQSENVIDRQDYGQLPAEPSLLAQALAGAQEIGERGQRGFGKIIAALMGDSQADTPDPQSMSREDLARSIRNSYGAAAWGGPASTDGGPFAGAWYDRGEQLMKEAFAEANRKDQSTVGGDMGADPPGMPGGFPTGMNDRDLDGDGIEDFAGQFAAGGRNSRMLNKKGLWGKETKQLGVPTTPGAAVTAPVGGKVVYADEFQSYGYTVIVRGEDGTHYDINGMQAGLVKPGDQVTAGQPIGVAGEQTNIGIKGANGKWGDPTSLADGLQSAGTAPVAGYDGGDDSYGVGSTGMDAGTATGLMGGPTAAGYADAGLRGAPMMPGVAPSADYADAGIGKRGEIAKALMGQALAPQAPDVTMIDSVPADFDFDRAIQANKAELAALDAPSTPAFDRSYASFKMGAIPGDPENWSQDGPTTTAAPSQALGPPMSDPRAAMHRDGLIDGDLAGPISTPAAPDFMSAFDKAYDAANAGVTNAAQTAWGGLQGLFGGSTDDAAASFERGFSPSLGGEDGGDPSKASMRSAAAALASPSMTAFGSPKSAKTPAALNAFGQFGDEAKFGTPSTSLADVDPMTSFTRSMDVAPSMVAGDPMGESMGAWGSGSFGGIGTPTADQAAIGQKGLSAAASALGKANGVTSIAKALGPLDAFHDAFSSSVKSVGPKAKAAFRDAYADPENVAKSLAAIDATRAYTSMDGLRNNPEVLGLRSQQIGDFGMANPALGTALGLSMGQQGQQGLGGGIGSDPFGGGRGFGGVGGPSGGSGGGFGGPGGQPSGPSFSGPSGPSAGRGGGYGGGTSGGQPSGPSISGPTGPGAGPGYSGGGNPGATGKSGNTGKTGPGAGPGQTGAPGNPGMSHAAAAAIGAALSHEAAAAAASDAARGFGGYGGFGPSFSGGFF